MFSSGLDAMLWQERNCYQCTQYESESKTIEEAKCKTAFEIDLGYISGEVSRDTEKIIKRENCKHRKAKNENH